MPLGCTFVNSIFCYLHCRIHPNSLLALMITKLYVIVQFSVHRFFTFYYIKYCQLCNRVLHF